MTVRRRRAAGVAFLAVAMSGCAATTDAGEAPSGSASTTASASVSASASAPAPPAREARVGPTQRLTFRPTRLALAGVSQGAAVERVETQADGVLDLPEDPGHVGWWEGGALAGEAYGTVVIAGHVDSAHQGLGFFARLLAVEVGQEVTLTGSGLRQRYRVRAVHDVPKADLAVATDPFSQDVRGRLVMVTCSGAFDRRTGSYEQNRLVYADPVGSAERATR